MWRRRPSRISPSCRDIVEVIAPGTQSEPAGAAGTRCGLWHVGVPPSGPMDDRSFRHANRLVGNTPTRRRRSSCTVSGPMLKFFSDVAVALAGAQMPMTLDGTPVPHGQAILVKAGQTLAIGAIAGAGQRSYLAVAGGFAAPIVSRLAHNLRPGQVRRPCDGNASCRACAAACACSAGSIEAALMNQSGSRATGTSACSTVPMALPISFSRKTSKRCSATEYEVHFNSARTGVRLIGPAAEMGAAPMAAKRDFIHPTCTTMPMRSAQSTSPATCRSSWAPTARASAASSARR